MSLQTSITSKSVLVVCWANFCRSPVAEYVLKNKSKQSLKINSAGIMPMTLPNFDKRSQNFLDRNNISYGLHLPKKVTKDLIDEHDSILAFDLIVLNELNKEFPKSKSKFKIFNYLNKSLYISDPYKSNVEDYNLVMGNIVLLCDLILDSIE